MVKMKKINDEVFYADEDIIRVDKEDIEFLKQRALKNERKKSRLCIHKDVNDKIHEMIIVHTHDTYVRPHKHLNKPEAFHIVEGEADVVLFDEKGKIIQLISMGEYSSGKEFYYKISEPRYHTLLIKSDIIVFKETTSGPFKKEDTIFAQWAPEDTNKKVVKDFMIKLAKQVEKMKK